MCVCECVFMSVCVFGWSQYGFAMQGPLDGFQNWVVKDRDILQAMFLSFLGWGIVSISPGTCLDASNTMVMLCCDPPCMHTLVDAHVHMYMHTCMCCSLNLICTP